jgi:hypothetical protein
VYPLAFIYSVVDNHLLPWLFTVMMSLHHTMAIVHLSLTQLSGSQRGLYLSTARRLFDHVDS